MPYYEFICSNIHETVEKRPMSQSGDVGPLCTSCQEPTKRIYSAQRVNMFVTIQESFEWADRIMSGKEPMPTPDKGAMHI